MTVTFEDQPTVGVLFPISVLVAVAPRSALILVDITKHVTGVNYIDFGSSDQLILNQSQPVQIPLISPTSYFKSFTYTCTKKGPAMLAVNVLSKLDPKGQGLIFSFMANKSSVFMKNVGINCILPSSVPPPTASPTPTPSGPDPEECIFSACEDEGCCELEECQGFLACEPTPTPQPQSGCSSIGGIYDVGCDLLTDPLGIGLNFGNPFNTMLKFTVEEQPDGTFIINIESIDDPNFIPLQGTGQDGSCRVNAEGSGNIDGGDINSNAEDWDIDENGIFGGIWRLNFQGFPSPGDSTVYDCEGTKAE